MSKLPFPAPKLPSLPPMPKVSSKDFLDGLAVCIVLAVFLAFVCGVAYVIGWKDFLCIAAGICVLGSIAWACDRLGS
ncbi:Uncharacterised protein [uncultured archaeon]|nr:Uncharacterised protein [uncultured archaeon]